MNDSAPTMPDTPAAASGETHRRLFEFPPFRLDLQAGTLVRDTDEIALRPKTFAVLAALVRRHGKLVSRESLMQAAWPGAAVAPEGLKNCIKELRKALGDSARNAAFIRTVHGRGYRFIAPVAQSDDLISDKSGDARAGRATILVDREQPLARLDEYLDRALNGERQLVFVNGEAGIGKTALADGFLARTLRCPGLLCGRGQCIDQRGTGEAYLPVVDALTDACRHADFDAHALMRNTAPCWFRRLPGNRTPRPAPQSGAQSDDGLLLELDEELATVSAEHPIVIVLEDLQWSDAPTLQLLSLFARRRSSARVLIVATYRLEGVVGADHPLPALKQELLIHRRCGEIALGPLSAAGILTYLEQRFHPTDSDHLDLDALAGKINARTDGNALFMTELLQHLIDRSYLRVSAEGWRLDHDLDTAVREMPADLQLFIDEQVNRLEPLERKILETASLVGPQFSARLITDVINISRKKIAAICSKLVKRNYMLAYEEVKLLDDGEPVQIFRFVHDLHRESLASRIPPAERTHALRAIAERVEKLYDDDKTSVYGELASLFEQCKQYRKAIGYFAMNARHLHELGAGREGRAQLARATELLNFVRDAEARRVLAEGLQAVRSVLYRDTATG